MRDTGQGSDKKSYPVILLLVVGLASFTSAMKELNQVRELTLEATHFVAQVKDVFAPADDRTTVSVETCQNSKVLVPLPPPLPVEPPSAPVRMVESDAIDIIVPKVAPAPPAPPKIRVVVRSRGVEIKEALRNVTYLIHKRDKRNDG